MKGRTSFAAWGLGCGCRVLVSLLPNQAIAVTEHHRLSLLQSKIFSLLLYFILLSAGPAIFLFLAVSYPYQKVKFGNRPGRKLSVFSASQYVRRIDHWASIKTATPPEIHCCQFTSSVFLFTLLLYIVVRDKQVFVFATLLRSPRHWISCSECTEPRCQMQTGYKVYPCRTEKAS